MTITKQNVLDLVGELPAKVDIDELIYRLYLRKKIESAEEDVRKNRMISHENIIKGTTKWFKK
ncbi:MAG: hypothetical protein KKH91_02200 [Elusimicrobia bacterium]|nr:hypothetical protein [Elusimicrobiota bacterium]MBU2614156.1 hypothetical protein [Elusimicrobiota bacterium]